MSSANFIDFGTFSASSHPHYLRYHFHSQRNELQGWRANIWALGHLVEDVTFTWLRDTFGGWRPISTFHTAVRTGSCRERLLDIRLCAEETTDVAFHTSSQCFQHFLSTPDTVTFVESFSFSEYLMVPSFSMTIAHLPFRSPIPAAQPWCSEKLRLRIRHHEEGLVISRQLVDLAPGSHDPKHRSTQ